METHTLWPTYISVYSNPETEKLAIPIFEKAANHYGDYFEKPRNFDYVDCDEGRQVEDKCAQSQ